MVSDGANGRAEEVTSAAWSLQRSIYGALVGDSAVTRLLGGAKVFDHVPRGASFPYVTFGQTTERDWSTGDEEGREHILTLHIWSQAAGRRQAEEVMAAVRAASQTDAPDLALLTDGLKAEREQGITIDVAYRYFATDKRKFIIADTPGHIQYCLLYTSDAADE